MSLSQIKEQRTLSEGRMIQRHMQGAFTEHDYDQYVAGCPECFNRDNVRNSQGRSIDITACVESGALIGKDVVIWRNSLIRYGAKVDDGVSIGHCCVLDNKVFIGQRSRIQDGAKVYGPCIVGKEVFIGPNVVITNDKYPKVQELGVIWNPSSKHVVIGDNASIGANAVVLPGVNIGEGAVVGAGTVVTEDVAAYTIVTGKPAKAA